MLTKNAFTKFDSIAIWDTPNNCHNYADLTPNQQDELFKTVFQAKVFNEEWLKNIRYDRVIIGQNPGNDGKDIHSNSLLSFHFSAKSNDHRLAATIYQTSFWGGLMTDLTPEFESNSELVNTDSKDVDSTLHHLKHDLHMQDDAVILCLGTKAYDAFKTYRKELSGTYKKQEPVIIGKHLVLKVPHYSGSNNNKNTRLSHAKLLKTMQQFNII
ncbi:uracil-DNA glycosylase family protein [Apilactobacillus xinyiensis]|uniref:uracil-DNA glycosylase family protein n=1 Tax=Apilactobacillus xinyiensis TaxID=2841032 RepID=UPI00200E8B98|nr:uracil-DNA glycosylase family protein [Apilactobacillus xinyiensis]MCL0319218.1 uracil-DNA glycosylase family protein [Apilactobacillus xinyiensis]